MNIAEIWKIEDVTNFITALHEHVCDKCWANGDEANLDALTEAERTLYITTVLEAEVNNGGFDQYFFNSSGNSANEAAEEFRKIGAFRIAEICEKAVSVFGGKVPVDWEERQERLEELDEDMLEEVLGECDDAFYEYEDDLDALRYAYVMKHREQFD